MTALVGKCKHSKLACLLKISCALNICAEIFRSALPKPHTNKSINQGLLKDTGPFKTYNMEVNIIMIVTIWLIKE